MMKICTVRNGNSYMVMHSMPEETEIIAYNITLTLNFTLLSLQCGVYSEWCNVYSEPCTDYSLLCTV